MLNIEWEGQFANISCQQVKKILRLIFFFSFQCQAFFFPSSSSLSFEMKFEYKKGWTINEFKAFFKEKYLKEISFLGGGGKGVLDFVVA